MSFLVAWVVFPLVLLALCVGLGLLVDLLSGRRLPGVLVVPVGFAAIVVVGEFTTATDATAELTVPVVLLLTVLGAGLSFPWRFGRLKPLPAAVAVGVFLVFGAPVILSGEPTFAGYIKLDDTATWLAMTDRVMEHGRNLAGLEPSTYRATLRANLPGGYPIGAFIPFGTAQKLVGGDLAWVFQPYLSFLAAMLSLSLWEILGGVVRRPGLRGGAAFIAAQPALLVGYALWGGVKEMVAAAAIALAAALAPAALRAGARPRDTIPLAIACASLAAQLSIGGLVWVAPMLLALAALALRRFGARGAIALAAPFVALLALLALPAALLGLPPSSPPITDPHALGNLIAPLNPFQALGIWPAGDFRVDPSSTPATAVLVALALAAAAIGLWVAVRRRALALLLYCTALIGCLAIVAITSPWNGGKALATASPIALSLAVLGALAALRLDRLAGGLLIVAIAGGVLWSNVLAYGGVSLAPYGELVELQGIGNRFAGEGPTLMTEYNPYGARHFLRKLDGEGATELRERTVPLRDGGVGEKGYAVDTDELDLSGLLEYRTLVLRRSPVRSRPPSPYGLAYSGDYYEVWQRPLEPSGAVPEHQPYGEGLQPAAVPKCGEIVGLGLLALSHHMANVRLLAARHAPVYDATDGSFEVPRAGDYTAWLKGSVRGLDELYVGGRKIGEVRQRIENEGGFIELGETHLSAGAHEAELHFGAADLHPGSAGFPRPETGPLLFAPTGEELGELVSVPIEESERLCGKPWDWIEAVGSG